MGTQKTIGQKHRCNGGKGRPDNAARGFKQNDNQDNSDDDVTGNGSPIARNQSGIIDDNIDRRKGGNDAE